MKKIKILRIIARLNIGGPAIHTILLTAGLDKDKFESLLLYGTPDKDEGDMLYYAAQKNISPIFVPELKRRLNFINDIVAFVKIYNIIKAEKPDIVHTHTAKAGTLGRLATVLYNILNFPKGRQVKLVHTFHGHVFEGYFNKLKTRVFVLIERILAVFSSKIITVSDSVKDELIALRICNERKITVIPLGFELERYLSIPIRETPGLNIGIVGRLVPIKNHFLFLDAAAKIIADNPGMELSFNIIGDGELRRCLEGYAHKLNIDSQVKFSGWQKDLAGVYSGLDIVASTSINEGTPVSLIEAMASGRAVVATDVGGIRDLLGEELDIAKKPEADFEVLKRGIIVEPGDSFSFAAAINFILRDNTLRKSIIETARGFVKNKFSKERLIRDVEGLYNGLLSPHQ